MKDLALGTLQKEKPGVTLALETVEVVGRPHPRSSGTDLLLSGLEVFITRDDCPLCQKAGQFPT